MGLISCMFLFILNQEQFAEKKILLESESEKQELEEEKRKLVVKAKNKLVKLWKEKKAEVFRYSKSECFWKFVFDT